jgi:hypothetical protein
MVGFNLTWTSSAFTDQEADGYRVRFEVTDHCNATNHVFAHRLLPVNPNTGKKGGFFSHVCSPVDLVDYPEDAPIHNNLPPFYRLPYADLWVRSTAELENIIAVVKDHLERLHYALKRLGEVGLRHEHLIGTLCPEPPVTPMPPLSSSLSSCAAEPLVSLSAAATSARLLGDGTWTGSPSEIQLNLLPGQTVHLYLHGFDLSALPIDARIRGARMSFKLRDQSGSLSSSSQGSFVSSVSSWSESISQSSESSGTPVPPAPPTNPSSSASFPCPLLPSALPTGANCPRFLLATFLLPDYGPLVNRAVGNCISHGDYRRYAFGSERDRWLPGSDDPWTVARVTRGEFGILLVFSGLFLTSPRLLDVAGSSITLYYQVCHD